MDMDQELSRLDPEAQDSTDLSNRSLYAEEHLRFLVYGY